MAATVEIDHKTKHDKREFTDCLVKTISILISAGKCNPIYGQFEICFVNKGVTVLFTHTVYVQDF